MANAWLVLAVPDEDRTHGGNDGYEDEPSQHYGWDSTVPNHAALTPGDVIALWDKKSLLGVSVIEKIDTGRAVKKTYTCPECGRARASRPRRNKTPAYRCWNCKAEFDAPTVHHKDVSTYRSSHSAAWVDLAGLLTGAELRSLCHAPNSQLSLRPLDWARMRDEITVSDAVTSVRIVDSAQRQLAGGHRLIMVRVRAGQGAFRRRLLEEHGEVCAFTGPTPAAALEAAHLYSYAADGQHRPQGGLLLRRDLHRLFDLGLIAVDPQQDTLDVAPKLADFAEYTRLHGRPVAVPLGGGHRAWLEAHWHLHHISR
ncbi:HNH endonuclease [Streptomyces gilvifuscus]|uniref:HNH endonuclease n=1 Tax=Streptomyces gilvifuscus TaxID=1550617 RepID=A0ABT5G134_9ACTN|nr:HNH endonuclease [Streptomyces gilvifuscus]MDC2958534.1 HNH endonuclease [Streptomyces gilvifuscus]